MDRIFVKLLFFVILVLPLSRGQHTDECSTEGNEKCESCGQIKPEWPGGDQGESGEVGERGNPGADGAVGEMGPPGEAGDQGEQGDQGERGYKGEKGDPGKEGEQGVPGLPGRATEKNTGKRGEVGPKGQKGSQGFSGCPGSAGKEGDQGEKGDKGVRGIEGSRGANGMKGYKGERGPAGPEGQQGRPGRKGDIGAPGGKGETGPVGDTGPQGNKGAVGPPGPVDAIFLFKGPAGPKGFRGRANFSLEPDMTSQEALDNKGPKGVTGEKGERGDPGSFGPRGPQGKPCDCTQVNTSSITAPRGVAGPTGELGNPEDFKGDQGDSPKCSCSSDCLQIPEFSQNKNNTGIEEKTIRQIPGVAGPHGATGEKGDPGPKGSGIPGEKGARGRRGDKQCCVKPPQEKSYGRTPTIYVVHSQETNTDVSCQDDESELLWTGFSFLYADINRVATAQDLGHPGSCVPGLDPIPYTDCTPGLPCKTNLRSMQAIWLLAVNTSLDAKSSQVPFSQLGSHISRCAVCIAKSPVITLHQSKACPANTRQLWSGYSLAMLTSSMLSVSVDLAHTGSCLQQFQTGLIIECDASKNCRRYPDLRSHWMGSDNTILPGSEKNCVVCVDQRSNEFDRDLPRPTFFAEHYQSPVAPLNPCSSAPGVFPIMTNGYSLLHVEDTRAVVQNLGSAGSCMPRFSPVPFLTCNTFGNCYAKERQTKAAWLSGLHVFSSVHAAKSSHLNVNSLNVAATPSVLSRCSVCISDGPVITVHSLNNSEPSCPRQRRGWAKLWAGYSFLGHFSNAAGGQQHLDSPGSCLREFMSPVNFECVGATGECRFQSDQHDFWLTASNAAVLRRNTRNTDRLAAAASRISRCAVCKMIINN